MILQIFTALDIFLQDFLYNFVVFAGILYKTVVFSGNATYCEESWSLLSKYVKCLLCIVYTLFFDIVLHKPLGNVGK